jgi:C4-dicarboxylate-specific signal transduction histidine kinase
VQERRNYRESFRIVRGDGSVGYQHAAACPVFNDAGDLVEYIGASMDSTDQWLRATELARASQAVQDMERQLARAVRVATAGELAASIAHEVNQPLAAVVANAHACLR